MDELDEPIPCIFCTERSEANCSWCNEAFCWKHASAAWDDVCSDERCQREQREQDNYPLED
jgi:hypothetical protein